MSESKYQDRQLSQVTKHCWKLSLIYWGFILFIIIRCEFYYSVNYFVITVLLGAVLFFILSKVIQNKIVKESETEFKPLPTDVQEFDKLDKNKLNQITQEFEALGFKNLKDYKQDLDNILVFVRLMVNEQYYCYAGISEQFQGEKTLLPLNFSISSSWEDDWVLGHTNQRVVGIDYIGFPSKEINFYNSDATPRELFYSHIEKRRQISEDLGLKIITDVSWDWFVEKRNLTIKNQPRLWKKRNLIIALIKATLIELKQPQEWLGDYRKLAKQRSK